MTASRRLLFVDHAGVMGGAEFSLLDVDTANGFQIPVWHRL